MDSTSYRGDYILFRLIILLLQLVAILILISILQYKFIKYFKDKPERVLNLFSSYRELKKFEDKDKKHSN